MRVKRLPSASFTVAVLVSFVISGCSETPTAPTNDGSVTRLDTISTINCTEGTYRKCSTDYPGVCAEGEQSCLASGFWGSCEPTILPNSQPERCTNNADDDCDGFVDEADMDCVSCTANESRDCTAIAFGICTDGQQICNEEQTWGVCGPKIRPGAVQEDCGNGLDDDCDDKTDAADEDCEACTPDAQRECNSGLDGICGAGTQICNVKKLWGPCVANVQPNQHLEDCTNHLDDDCDGAVDGADTDCQACQPTDPAQNCPTGLPGICSTGTQTCGKDNTWGSCTPNVLAGTQQENCNLEGDEDCNGSADQFDPACFECQPSGLPLNCFTGLPGICNSGEKKCQSDGTWEALCTPLIAVGNQSENCNNGTDDDCDGKADGADSDCYDCTPATTQPCDTPLPGVCKAGQRTCLTNGTWETTCTGLIAVGSRQENCTNGTDDDCDGKADGADSDCYDCNPGATQSCSTGLPGVCSTGQRSCQTDGSWETACTPTVTPNSRVENCTNGSDDDCDGKTDGADSDCYDCTPGTTKTCSTSLPGVCSSGQQKCLSNGTWETTCTPLIAPNSQAENCTNSVDDDCDGNIDGSDSDCFECTPGTKQTCNTGLSGVCSAGANTCLSNGSWSTTCVPLIAPYSRAENCTNGTDDDCDGRTDAADDDCFECTPGATQGCSTGLPGVCSTGEKSCLTNGTWSTTCTATITVGSQPENCTNGRDDDCDGRTDSADSDDCCFSGATQECDAGNAFCMGMESCVNNVWGSCVLNTESEAAWDNTCNGVDEDCDGVADDGGPENQMQGPTYIVEYLPEAVTNRLIGQSRKALLYSMANGSGSHWGLWDAWVSNPAQMLAMGTQLHVLLNKLTTSTTFFTATDFPPINASTIMIGTPGFPDSRCSYGCLMVIRGSTVKMVNLGGSRASYSINLSSFPWGSPPATTPPTSLRAATTIAYDALRDANNLPYKSDAVAVLVNGSRCWLWSEKAPVLNEIIPGRACFCSGTNQNCPSDAVLNNLDAITYFMGGDGSHALGLASGDTHYSSVIGKEIPGVSVVSYQWSSLPIDAYTCAHPR
ncbi:MAG: hypothetical protein JRH20_12835 [Deltaproteobacteria bacterium]|nr:hypothetical protein [Deltaproteobacteria bacterium]